jgi:hypothetical protein
MNYVIDNRDIFSSYNIQQTVLCIDYRYFLAGIDFWLTSSTGIFQAKIFFLSGFYVLILLSILIYCRVIRNIF